jgi:hypothetical protein
METILQTISDEPMAMTYLGIGSAPHLSNDAKLEAKYDQLIPTCFHEMLHHETKTMRILHFDPWFEQQKNFLLKYFEDWKLVPVECAEGFHWIGEKLDIYVFPSRIEHEDHFWFFESLVERILNTGGKLLVQEYTGYDNQGLNTKLYQACPEKEKYTRRILFDMTYGTDTGCCTDMTKAQPFYDYNGNFINLHFMTESDAKRWVGISQKLDTILRQKYIAKYLQTLNTYHVDYRRRLKGETCLYGSPFYTNESSPDEIMKVLQQQLLINFDILQATQLVQASHKATLQELFQSYKEKDPYKWYDSVAKLLPRP